MAAANDSRQPASMVLMGGPIDPAANPTEVNRFALSHSLSWFERMVTTTVPARYPGAFRRVYPGFLQLAGFLSMNFDRHVEAHWRMFRHLVEGDGESAAATRAFYDEYASVMDLPADFYLQTVDRVFQRQDLAHGRFRVRGDLVDPGAVERTALMTVEGERDDICGVGQTEAAHRLCRNLSPEKKAHHLQPKVRPLRRIPRAPLEEEIYPRSPPSSGGMTPPVTADCVLSMAPRIEIRFATAADCSLLLGLIRALATFERAPDAVVATEADLLRYGFGPDRHFEAILAFVGGEPAGFAAFHSRFSTWLGRPGLYLEDLFVIESARGHGVGRRLMARLAAIAVERSWGRIDFRYSTGIRRGGFTSASVWDRSATGCAMAATSRRSGGSPARTKREAPDPAALCYARRYLSSHHPRTASRCIGC